MFSIGDLSKRVGVKVPTIRYYEQIGLLEPPERSNGNQRRYSPAALKRLSFIRHSRELGFSIEDISELLDLSLHPEEPCREAHAIAVRHLEDVQKKLKKLRGLEMELKRVSECDANNVSQCTVIETLADHQHCMSDH